MLICCGTGAIIDALPVPLDPRDAENAMLTATVADLTARLQRLSVESERARPLDDAAGRTANGGFAVPAGSSVPAASTSARITTSDSDRDALIPGRIQSLKKRFEGLGMKPPLPLAPVSATKGVVRADARRSSPDTPSTPAALESARSLPESSLVPPEVLLACAFDVGPNDQAAFVRHLVASPDGQPQQPIHAAILLRTLGSLRAAGQGGRADALLEAYVNEALDHLARQATDSADLVAQMALLANALHLFLR